MSERLQLPFCKGYFYMYSVHIAHNTTWFVNCANALHCFVMLIQCAVES